ncbi:unnamed protein product [Alternaria alternata]
MWEPRSIFTGTNTTSTPHDTTPEQRRLNIASHHEPLATTPGTLESPIVLDTPANLPVLQPPWTPKSPLDHRDWNRPPASAPLQSSRRHSGKQQRCADTTGCRWHQRPPPFSDFASASASSTHPPAPASEPLHKRRKRTRVRDTPSTTSASPRAPTFARTANRPRPSSFLRENNRPQLPARFSSSEAAARMLSKTREDSGIKTVTLARGTFSGLSPPGPLGAASGRTSERSSVAPTASPDSRDKSDPLRILGSVGIVELLEQDERPTFIVDTGDFANYMPESSRLQILFSNNALRSNPSTWSW